MRARRGPVSVVLPDELRERVAAEAKRRGLKVSSTVRALVMERVEELEDQEQLTRAEEWQRAEAWGSWERFLAGDRREVTRADLRDDIDRSIRRASRARKPGSDR